MKIYPEKALLFNAAILGGGGGEGEGGREEGENE